MDIKTRFNIGDQVCTIDKAKMKLKKFTIGSIHAFVTERGVVTTYYRAKDEGCAGDSYEDGFCFASEADLMKYVTTNA